MVPDAFCAEYLWYDVHLVLVAYDTKCLRHRMHLVLNAYGTVCF